jgi:hypothetical protein
MIDVLKTFLKVYAATIAKAQIMSQINGNHAKMTRAGGE